MKIKQPQFIAVAILAASILTGACQTQPIKPEPLSSHRFAILMPPANAGTGFNFYETFPDKPPLLMLTNQPWNGTTNLVDVYFGRGQTRWFTAETTNSLTGEAAQYGTSVWTNTPSGANTALTKASIMVIQ